MIGAHDTSEGDPLDRDQHTTAGRSGGYASEGRRAPLKAAFGRAAAQRAASDHTPGAAAPCACDPEGCARLQPLSPHRAARGRTGEEAAALFLSARGYAILGRNQRTPLGELDLVCRDSVGVVIVEVKSRSGHEFGEAFEAIGPRKARRLRASAAWWLADRGMFPCQVRFDAVEVVLDGRGMPCSVRHLPDVLEG